MNKLPQLLYIPIVYTLPYPLRYAKHTTVKAELERFKAEGVIEPIQFTDWAAPIITVLKAN